MFSIPFSLEFDSWPVSFLTSQALPLSSADVLHHSSSFSPSHQPNLTKLLTIVSSALLLCLSVQFCFWQHGSSMHFSLHPELLQFPSHLFLLLPISFLETVTLLPALSIQALGTTALFLTAGFYVWSLLRVARLPEFDESESHNCSLTMRFHSPCNCSSFFALLFLICRPVHFLCCFHLLFTCFLHKFLLHSSYKTNLPLCFIAAASKSSLLPSCSPFAYPAHSQTAMFVHFSS